MKFLAKIIIVIAIFLAGFYVSEQYGAKPDLTDNAPAVEEQNNEQIKVNLMLDFGNGEIKTFNDAIVYKDSASVFQLLEKTTQENNIEFKYKDYGGEMGAMIESIGGEISNFEADQWWQYWVNNRYSQVGASNYQLQDGDVVEWKHVKGQLDF